MDGDDAILIERFDLGGDGLRVAIKDTIDIAGHATRGGSGALADAPAATEHAEVVARVLDAGCRIVGRANMHELAYGVTGINAHTGTALNPRFPDRIPGGSSSGSAAAVAAGYADFTLGSDTGGSIRIPACCCGVVGFKPSFGRVSRKGAAPAVTSLDCVGPFADDVATVIRAMEIIDPTFVAETLDHAPVLGSLAVAASEEVADAVAGALAESGVALTDRAVAGFVDAFDAGIKIIAAETWAAFGALTASPAMGADVRARLLAASKVTAEELAAAEAVRTRVSAAVDAALAGVDALVLPTMPDVPPTLEEATDARAAISITALVRIFNLTGHPAVSLPIRTARGLPAGIQLVGRKGDDARLLAVAAVLEAGLARRDASASGRSD